MAESGLIIVDKPADWTSHDVVAKMRRIAGTRRVGHAGTLDPMATGVLVLGVEKATRLLGHLMLTEKEYRATIRLGVSTNTDDAEGEVTATASAAGVGEAEIGKGVEALTGAIMQVPPQVSAIKVNGQRAYKKARAGEEVELAARPITVSSFDVLDIRPEGDVVDVDAVVVCSSGTYIRSLARDLGAALGVGGHLTALRRTRVGPFTLDHARTLEALEADPSAVVPLDAAVAMAFPRRDLDAAQAADISHGRPLPPTGRPGTHGVFAPDGRVLALVADKGRHARPLVVLAPAAT